MAGLNTGDIVEVRLNGILFNQRTLNVLHYRITTNSGEPVYADAIEAFAGGFDAGTNNPTLAMIACQCPQFLLESISAQSIYPLRKRAYRHFSDLPGTNAGDCTASNVSATIEKWSWDGSRHGVGALHIPGVPAEAQVGGLWNGAYLTLLNVVATRMRVVYVPPEDAVLTAEPLILNRTVKSTSLRLDGASVQPTIRTMRRRTVGVGK